MNVKPFGLEPNCSKYINKKKYMWKFENCIILWIISDQLKFMIKLLVSYDFLCLVVYSNA